MSPAVVSKLSDRVNVAAGNKPADLVIKNVTVLNVATGSQVVTDIAISNGHIVGLYDDAYEGVKVIDGTTHYSQANVSTLHLAPRHC